MSKSNFPDKKVEKAIFDLAKDLSLEIQDISHTSNKDDGDSDWKWTLARPAGNVHISVSVQHPSYLTFISLTNTNEEMKGKVSKHFSFNDYLSKYLKNRDDSNHLNNIALDRSWKNNWPVVLDIFKAHAMTDMREIINGKDWPNIEFNLADYVDADAMERIYQDQLKLIEESKKEKGWLHFINFKKKK